MTKRIALLFGIVLGVFGMTTTAAAQTRQIEYGTFTIASLDQNVQGGFFTFNATEGDFISVEAVALSGSLNPRVTLLNASSTTLAVNSDDPFQPGIGDARLTYRLPATSSYTVLVEAENSTDGQYLLRLERADLPPASPLGLDVITTANISGEVPLQVYSFDSAAGDTVMFRGVAPELEYAVEVYGPNGQMFAVQDGGVIAAGSTTVPANTGTYTMIVRNVTGATSGGVEVELASGMAAPAPVQADAGGSEDTDTTDTDVAETPAEEDNTGDEETAPAEEQPDVAEAPPAADEATTVESEGEAEGEAQVGASAVGSGVPANRCTVTPSDGGVVIRQGPDTDFPAIASIPVGEFRFADATDGAWIRLVGNGWVSSGVVELNGPCGALPLVSVPTEPGGSAETTEQDNQEPEQPQSAAPVGQR